MSNQPAAPLENQSAPAAPSNSNYRSSGHRALGSLVFASRWLQAPLYVGLIVAQGVYVVQFFREMVHLVVHFSTMSEQEILLLVLALVDVVMIANLLIMVIIGGYETFVSRIRLDEHPDQPEWLSHVNANVLKIKLAMAIIGISSVHLLSIFIRINANPDDISDPAITDYEGVKWQVIIHAVFILSAMGLAWIDRLSDKKAAH